MKGEEIERRETRKEEEREERSPLKWSAMTQEQGLEDSTVLDGKSDRIRRRLEDFAGTATEPGRGSKEPTMALVRSARGSAKPETIARDCKARQQVSVRLHSRLSGFSGREGGGRPEREGVKGRGEAKG